MALTRKPLTKNKRVKAIARKQVGSPPPAQVFQPKSRRAKPKYPPDPHDLD